ncbi:1-phosphofructokinase family hexose kinase [Eremococcus coleocola]|uniref:Tagatose-6-phosphate kinase n=1 Tax=Eremococcus coleocola ACS-139-V-Col8 TaxID=908337 RepID=E4KN54_9LACT|nr:PfkB family carbohydrate kinase [Eremococcus coleocola]EFR31597.1 hexose kinase, 1-phosphofructokinase family [Eremococcus coleocola ACS-139-V-Col8]
MIYTITLNPAIDRLLRVSGEILPGNNNRILDESFDVGGKGTHVSIGLKTLGVQNHCTGIVGERGSEQLLKLLDTYSVSGDFIKLKNEKLRTNLVIKDEIESGNYLISEMGIELTKELIDLFIQEKLADINKGDWLVISGDPSQKTKPNVFKYLLDELTKREIKLFLDVSAKYLLMSEGTNLEFIKPNQFEFSEMVGREVRTIKDCIHAYFNNLNLFKHIKHTVITLGSHGSILLSENCCFVFSPLSLDIVNDTGAGDAFVSGFIYGLKEGMSAEKACAFANAVGAAKTQVNKCAGFNLEQVNKYFEEIEWKEMKL